MKFGTSGLRGLVTDLRGRASAVYSHAFALHLLQGRVIAPGDVVLVGRDFRASSLDIASTAIGALRRLGLQPIDCGAVPTPALALHGRKMAAASLMVTGSHIPDDRNGIKFYKPSGEIDKRDELEISAIVDRLIHQEFDFSPEEALLNSTAAEELFFRRSLKLIPEGGLSGIRVGVYQHSTVARDLLLRVLSKLGADVVALGRSESFVPIDTEAISSDTLASLRHWSKQYRLDAIVSADGDGDRPLFADEAGEPVRGDLLGLVAALLVGATTIVTPITSNSGIDAIRGFNVIRTKVGSPFVIAEMDGATAAGSARVVGFEANGGFLINFEHETERGKLDALPTRDSFLPILAMLELMARTKRPVSELVKGFQLPATASDRLERYSSERGANLISYLAAREENSREFLAQIGRASQINSLDGLRFLLEDGRIVHLRPSGNAPEMRCYVEAATDNEASALLKEIIDLVRSWAPDNNISSNE